MYRVGRHESCGKPFAVIRETDGKKMGCFSSRKSADTFKGQLEARNGVRKESDLLKTAFESSEDDRAIAVIEALAAEEELELEDEPVQKSGLAERFFDYLSGNVEKAQYKRENGIDYPARDFAFVPDKNTPATWKLRLTESPGKITATQLGRAVAALSAGGFRGQRADIPPAAVTAVKRRIRAEYRRLGVGEAQIPNTVKESNHFSLWKQADGQYRWFAVYSNMFRDDDGKPEIIAKESHEQFVAMVDLGLVAYPELWHYHVPGTRWGVADWVGFSEGFALASGTVDAGHEKEAELLAEMDDIGVSHGMPLNRIMRDETDPSIITMHVTTEISPLPLSAAANKLTTFFVKENEMPLSKDKRDHLKGVGYTDAEIDRLESSLKETAEVAAALGIESKEATPAEEPTAEAPATEEVPAADVTVPETDAPAAETDSAKEVTTETPVSRSEIADALKAISEVFASQLAQVSNAVGELTTEVKSLKQDESEKIAKAAEATPAMSLSEMLTGMFNKDAAVDGRTKLASQKPAEPKEEASAVTGYDFLDRLLVKPQE